jgi:hypothetical protein
MRRLKRRLTRRLLFSKRRALRSTTRPWRRPRLCSAPFPA